MVKENNYPGRNRGRTGLFFWAGSRRKSTHIPYIYLASIASYRHIYPIYFIFTIFEPKYHRITPNTNNMRQYTLICRYIPPIYPPTPTLKKSGLWPGYIFF